MYRNHLIKSQIRTARLYRLIAKAIDLIVVFIMAAVFFPVGLLISVVYLAISDSFFEGQSLGKKIMGFAVISLEDGNPCGVKQSVIRNLPIVVPLMFALIPFGGWFLAFIIGIPLIMLELYLLFRLDTGRRLGDVMADTSVIAGTNNKAGIKSRRSGQLDTQLS